MRLAGVIAMAALLTAGTVVAAEIPQAERRSGYTFMGPDTTAKRCGSARPGRPTRHAPIATATRAKA
jgi:sulfur-oxidizing protein SoxA